MESIRRGTYGNFRLAPRRLRHDPARKYETTRREKRPGHDRTSIIQHTLPRKIENLFNRGDRATLKCSRAVPILFSHLSILFFPFLFYLFIFFFFDSIFEIYCPVGERDFKRIRFPVESPRTTPLFSPNERNE